MCKQERTEQIRKDHLNGMTYKEKHAAVWSGILENHLQGLAGKWL